MNDILEYTDYTHKGYTLRQYNTLHYQIIDESGKAMLYASATKKLTDDEKKKAIADYIKQLKAIQNKDKLKACEICGKMFLPKAKNQKYCGKRCKKHAKSKQMTQHYQDNKQSHKRICRYCEKEFTPTTHYRYLCSDACKRKIRLIQETKPRLKRGDGRIDSLCWYCINACGGCSWSRKLIPVEGWKATEVTNKDVCDSFLKSYKVIECPEFEEGR